MDIQGDSDLDDSEVTVADDVAVCKDSAGAANYVVVAAAVAAVVVEVVEKTVPAGAGADWLVVGPDAAIPYSAAAVADSA